MRPSVSSSIEGCGTNNQGAFSTGFVNQFSQQTPTPGNTVFCLENIGSFDPNDKAAIPLGYERQQVFESIFITSEMLINIEQWPSTWYAIQLLDKNGTLLGNGRLVKQ